MDDDGAQLAVPPEPGRGPLFVDYQAYYTLGENILVGPGGMSADSIEGAWRASAPHWANITNRSFNVVGIGYVRGPDGRIWAVQEFGGL